MRPERLRRDFRLYQAARFLTTIADQMLAVGVAWQLYALTGRALDLGFLGLAQFVPAAGLSLAAGHASDRFDRRRVIGLCAAALAFTSALLWASSRAGPTTFGIYGAMALAAAARTFLAPAQQAVVPDLVPAGGVANAIAWGATLWEAAAIAGPPLGGWLYAAGHGAGAVYLAGAAAYLAAAVLTGAMTTRAAPSPPAGASFRTLLAGVVYVWRNKVLLGSISLDLFAVLFGGAVALLPVFARDILHVGPAGLGLLRSAPSIGAALVALALAVRPFRQRAGSTLLAAVAVYGIATILFGASRSFGLSLLALALVGASDMVSVVIRSTLVQVVTPAAMRGRVNAVNMVFVGASADLGALESGAAAALVGSVPAVILGGVAACLVVGLYARLFPGLRRVDTLEVPARAA